MSLRKSTNSFSDESFRTFAKALEHRIAYYGPSEDFFERQRQQMEDLIRLEREFREALISNILGPEVYRQFMVHIREERRNILDARPFFRERGEYFSDHISDVFKASDYMSLFPYAVNYRFVAWVVGLKLFDGRTKVSKLAAKIKVLRKEIIELNLPLAINRARVFYNKTPKSHLSYMDLVQIAAEGLLEGVDKYSPDPGGVVVAKTFRATAVGRMAGSHIQNYCVDQETILVTCDGKQKKIKDFGSGDTLWGVDDHGQVIQTSVVRLHDHGILQGWEVVFDDGYSIISSEDHKYLTGVGMKSLKEIAARSLEVFCDLDCQDRWMAESVRFEFQKKKRPLQTHYGVPKMSGSYQGCEVFKFSESTSTKSQDGGLEISLRDEVCVAKREERSSKNVSSVPMSRGGNGQGSFGHIGQVEGGESGEIRQDQPRVTNTQASFYIRNKGKNSRIVRPLEEKQSRRVLCQHEKGLGGSEVVEDGGVVADQRDTFVGGRSDQMWGREEAGRLCFARSQNMDRGGRFLPFSRSIKENPSVEGHTDTGRDVESRMPETFRRDVAQDFVSMFSSGRQDEGRVAGVAYANAPLASTGNLVRRYVVRVRAVGPRRMYDIEVSHPKHNFLLPNGIVTANSETLLHFFPLDRRKLYRAHKASRMHPAGADPEDISNAVNEAIDPDGLTPKLRTNPEEITDLVAAASTVSADSSVPTDPDAPEPIDRFAAPDSSRPDRQVEVADSSACLRRAFNELTVVEVKLLRIKGVRP